MQPIFPRVPATRPIGPFLIYAQRFDVIPQLTSTSRRAMCPEPTTGMYVVKHATRVDGSRVGGVVALSRLRAPAPLLPRFVGDTADPRLTKHNSLEYSPEAWLNKFHDKDLFYTLTMTAAGAS